MELHAHALAQLKRKVSVESFELIALLTHDVELLDGQTLGQIETAMEEFFCYVEAMTALRRFPKPNESTTGLVSRLGGMVKDCRG